MCIYSVRTEHVSKELKIMVPLKSAHNYDDCFPLPCFECYMYYSTYFFWYSFIAIDNWRE